MATTNVLFIVENNSFPRDTRVYNECRSISNRDSYQCYTISPRSKGQKFHEHIEDGLIECYRYPHFDSKSMLGLFIEYLNASVWLFILVPIICTIRRINVLHVANPPDFIIPMLWFLKVFGVRFIYDQHDLSVLTYKGKSKKPDMGSFRAIEKTLLFFEKESIRRSDIIISTNESIMEYTKSIRQDANIHVVRNSNLVRYSSLAEIDKRHTNSIEIGYFGYLNNDHASGYSSFIPFAREISKYISNYRFTIIGGGPGATIIKDEIEETDLEEKFVFIDFVPLNIGFDYIKQFDYGFLPWPDLEKNNFHTAMKLMDYMCCAVPVCSLPLKEQLITTGGIGIHSSGLSRLAQKLYETYINRPAYEELRASTLERFNNDLSWPRQQAALYYAYDSI